MRRDRRGIPRRMTARTQMHDVGAVRYLAVGVTHSSGGYLRRGRRTGYVARIHVACTGVWTRVRAPRTAGIAFVFGKRMAVLEPVGRVVGHGEGAGGLWRRTSQRSTQARRVGDGPYAPPGRLRLTRDMRFSSGARGKRVLYWTLWGESEASDECE